MNELTCAQLIPHGPAELGAGTERELVEQYADDADSAPDQPNLLRVETAEADRDWSLVQAAAIAAAEAAAATAAAEVAAEAAVTAQSAVDAASAAAAKAAHRAREVASDAADAVAAIATAAAGRQSRSQQADARTGRHTSPGDERTCPREPGTTTAPAELADATAEAARRVARRVELVAAAAASAAAEAAIVIASRVECDITSAAADVNRASLRLNPLTARERRRSPITEAHSPAAEASAAAATIRSLHRSGASALTIAAKLNRVGSRTRRDARWSSRSVLDMLQLFPVGVDDVSGARPSTVAENPAP